MQTLEKGLFFPFLYSKTLLGYLLFHPWVTAQESQVKEGGAHVLPL